ncbi:surface-associated interspersed protein 8.2 (SURFIN 8.2) (SURF8.2), partial [Plasmodium malariae]
MDSCFSSYVPIFGYDLLSFLRKTEFKKIITHVQEKTKSLKNEKNKQNFRRVCLELAEYLIKKKKEPPPFEREHKWELALKYWLQQYYKGLNKYGGCFMILNEEDKKVLDFIYEAEDFCSEKNRKKPNCINTEKRSNKKCDSACLNHTAVQQNKEQHPDVSHDLTIHQDQDSLKSLLQIQNLTTQQSESAPDHQAEDKKSLSGTPNMKNQADVAESVQTETSSILKNSDILSSETSTESLSAASDTKTLMLPHGQGIIPLFPETLEPVSSTFFSPALNKTPGLLKKRKSIKRRQVKLLRILIPSQSNRKKKILTHDHPENTIYDEEQIIKKLKIHEHHIIKNIKSSKQKKDRFKTIIEVHMEVLEEFRNEEWEHKKGEFLELCL